jgi:hypothetical protein
MKLENWRKVFGIEKLEVGTDLGGTGKWTRQDNDFFWF